MIVLFTKDVESYFNSAFLGADAQYLLRVWELFIKCVLQTSILLDREMHR